MSKHKTGILVAAAALGGLIVGQMPPAEAQLDRIFKGGAILLVVDRLGPQIDRFVNNLTGNRSNNLTESTRVVPILTIGKGTYAGAVQVTGPKELVDTVEAVAQAEGKTKIGSEVRARALIPVSSRSVNRLESLSRVKGVGVSALVDIKL